MGELATASSISARSSDLARRHVEPQQRPAAQQRHRQAPLLAGDLRPGIGPGTIFARVLTTELVQEAVGQARDDGAAGPTSARGGMSDAAASSGEAVIAGATISPRSGGDALLAVRVDDVDSDIAELALVLASVVPAEDEIAAARATHARRAP